MDDSSGTATGPLAALTSNLNSIFHQSSKASSSSSDQDFTTSDSVFVSTLGQSAAPSGKPTTTSTQDIPSTLLKQSTFSASSTPTSTVGPKTPPTASATPFATPSQPIDSIMNPSTMVSKSTVIPESSHTSANAYRVTSVFGCKQNYQIQVCESHLTTIRLSTRV